MAVRDGLLVLLAEQPRHGYDLRAELQRRTAGLWDLNSGQVYTTLDRLERDGLVESAEDDSDPSGRRKVHRLTAAGHAAAEAWLDEPAGAGEAPRDELLLKVLLAAHQSTDRARAVIEAERHALLTRLHGHRRAQTSGAGEHDDGADLAARIVDDVLVSRLEADLRWLDRTEEQIRDHDHRTRGGNP